MTTQDTPTEESTNMETERIVTVSDSHDEYAAAMRQLRAGEIDGVRFWDATSDPANPGWLLRTRDGDIIL